MLRGDVVQAVMMDELDDLNQSVWKQKDTLDHMKTVPDYALVRSRWVMANKGDYKEPDACA